jgi:nitroimidazol reductase NimA-like FMN-containing flavoprotein (pyridoxamine 5'-phosphate oxidase superfamily)
MSDPGIGTILEVQRRSYDSAGSRIQTHWPETQALDRDGLGRLFADLTYGVLATARPDGRAHAAPVAFSVEGGAFWVASVEGLRLRNLRATPWASLVLTEGQRGDAHRALTAEGSVRVHEGEQFNSLRRRLDAEWAARHGKPPAWAVAFIELTPDRVFSHAEPDA